MDLGWDATVPKAMNSFLTLYQTPRPMIGDRLSPDLRSELFPELVQKSKRLHFWRPGEAITRSGLRLLVGIATWSVYDMSLLDMIDETSESGSMPLHIDVFDVGESQSAEDIGRAIPGIGKPSQTPLLGLWKNGEISERASGYDARNMIAFLCGLDVSKVQEQMRSLNMAS